MLPRLRGANAEGAKTEAPRGVGPADLRPGKRWSFIIFWVPFCTVFSSCFKAYFCICVVNKFGCEVHFTFSGINVANVDVIQCMVVKMTMHLTS